MDGDDYWAGGGGSGDTDWSSYDFSGGSSMPNATLITSYDKPGVDYGSFADLYGASYSNEGRNYPTTESTQGPGGSPMIASTASGWDKLLGFLKNQGTIGKGASSLLDMLGAKGSTAGLLALLSYLDRQKPSGGGVAQAYAGPSRIPTRTITQGKYGPIAQYAAEGGLMQAYAGGGKVQMEDGGFVMTKKAVDGAGGPAGIQQLLPTARMLRGPGTGTSDDIPAVINSAKGQTPARVSNGEAYIPKDLVQRLGGAQRMYNLMHKLQKRA